MRFSFRHRLVLLQAARIWRHTAFAVGLLWLGAALVLDSKMTAGAMMSCYTLSGFIVGPVMVLLNGNHALQQALIVADRLFEIVDLCVSQAKNRR